MLEYIPNVDNQLTVSRQFNDIIVDIKRRVFNNPDKYIKGLSSLFLLEDNKYHKLIYDIAIMKGNLGLIHYLNVYIRYFLYQTIQ